MEGNFKIPLGAEVKDKITGFIGIVVGRTEWATGCRRYAVQSTKLKDGIPTEPQWIDEVMLTVLKTHPVRLSDAGGPTPAPKRPKDPTR